jgi:hypothetical protein
MESFRQMTNDCIRIGLAEGRASLKFLSLTCYPKLKRYEAPSAYKLCAISKASGILKHHQRLSRKHHVNEPYCSRPSLTTCYGMKTLAGKLRIAGNVEISLNTYVERFLSQPGVEVRYVSFAAESMSISVRR